MSAKETYDKLLGQVRSSNLNFLVKETPYSVFISVRKSSANTSEKQDETDGNNLQNTYDELKGKYNDLVNKYNELLGNFEDMKNKNSKENIEKNKLLNKMMKK